MWYLYLDESGDLGFDFVNKNPSKYFTVTILAISADRANRNIINAVKKTLRRKLNPKNKRNRHIQELKGTGTTQKVKEYFFNQIKQEKFGIYSITLNKKRLFERLTKNKSRTYNYIARKVIDTIPFEKSNGNGVFLIIDKSKGKPEIEDFNGYIRHQLQARIDIKTSLEIQHFKSHENYGLQACDLFCWGIFRKYEKRKGEWFAIFKDKVIYDEVFLK